MLRKRQLSGSSNSENFKIAKTVLTCKENIPPEVTSPAKRERCAQDLRTEITTPKKSCENLDEPATPSAFLKVLSSVAASLDYAGCNTPKSSKVSEGVENQVSCDSDMSDMSSAKVNRKEKSLAIICTRFLSRYPIYPTSNEIKVSLDETSVQLGVERRRLYDIVNVFESIDILKKTGKNQYTWFGKNNLFDSLCKLKDAAIKDKMLEKLQYVMKLECTSNCKQSCILSQVQTFNKTLDFENSPILATQVSSDARREKSLGIMCQKFLMLFLVSPNKIISLGVAAKVLNGFLQRNDKGAQIKTQIRRLYDIANVLSSIDLIRKEVAPSQNGRKPAFKYVGPDLKVSQDDIPSMNRPVSQQAMKTGKTSFVRHSSFQDICAVAEIEHQKMNFEESHNSAPPFDSALADQKDYVKTNFKNLQINDNIAKTKIKTESEEIKPKVKTQYLVKPNMKLINLAKSANPTVPYYIINNAPREKSDIKHLNAGYGTQTYLLINTVTPSKDVKTRTENNPVNKTSSSQTITLSSQQRDAILQSLNISLSSEQIAAIHLDGASQPSSSDKPLNVLKIVNKDKTQHVSGSATNIVRLSAQKEAELNLSESNGVNHTNTRSNSPSSMQAVDSPLSIPSGYATPIPNVSSDISFVSNIEVNDILKKIESQTNFEELNKINTCHKENSKVYNPTTINFGAKNMEHVDISIQNLDAKEKITCKSYSINNIDVETNSRIRINQLASNDSCSSDSLNLEVSNIFKGKDLEKNSVKPKTFLIDEKTLLSPIKAPISFSPNLITPPYLVPETIFLFNNSPVSYQTTNVNNISTLLTSVPKLHSQDKGKNFLSNTNLSFDL